MKRGAPDYEALVLDYTSAGRFEEALAVAELAIAQPVGEQTLLHYYKSWCLIRLGKTAEAQIAIATAEKEPADYCFPNALEAIEALQCVVDFAGKAPKHFITWETYGMINAGIPLPSQPGSALRAKTRHSPPYGVICHWLTSTK